MRAGTRQMVANECDRVYVIDLLARSNRYALDYS